MIGLMQSLYPFLDDGLPLSQELPPTLNRIKVRAGTVLFDENTPCQGFPLVLSGEITVTRHSEDGRSLELYRVLPGQICLVSAACLFRGQLMTARGVASTATELAIMTPEHFENLLEKPAFRREILILFAERMTELTSLVDAIAFHRLDQRLARVLLSHGPVWLTTHQAIAEQLGTVREIVTRLLKRFENAGWVVLSRERIEICDVGGLRSQAAELR